eukprot:CAMPEP_0177600912 /NCGR_PEP_ID=MMETSP0419_2-20121207/13934_1 /TAXON_ID=582737 /ORGANISM="Tetraselmis sp., Strain GSL018" /LENGTH=588 /DNA_ID=CAMNT_0019094053 /DNA_START=70 /DNA_END=1833 /DNA_ORIENTATION=-
MAPFSEMAAEFRPCHSNPVNVALHLVTTPAGIVSTLCLLNASQGGSPALSCALTALYGLALVAQLPLACGSVSSALLAAAAAAAALWLPLSALQSALLLAAAYGGQELAHVITGEVTYQSTYIKKSGGLQQLLMHTYYLLPLCLDAACHSNFLTVWFVAHNDVLTCRLETPEERAAMRTITDWVISQSPSTEHTTHWWYQRLPGRAHAAFKAVIESPTIRAMFECRFPHEAYAVEPIDGMNEIYVASDKHSLNSDTVFYMEHVDGPWVLYPFCHVYRCICSMNENSQILTQFNNVPAEDLLTDGLVSGLDFNREVHRIANHPTNRNTGHRITLKNHYLVYPRVLRPYGRLLGRLTTAYNVAARNLFLSTIKTETLASRLGAWLVLGGTQAMFLTQQYVGFPNLLYVACLAAADRLLLPGRNVFLVGTSFVHYCMYMSHFYRRYGLAHGTFVRNAVFFKCLAVGQLALMYLRSFEPDPVSAALLVAGYGLSASAAAAIGIDRTYFGSEMGIYKPKWISAFPYSLGIPHPMIVGSVVGLLGFHKLAGVRAAYPWLVPAHVAFYAAHCLQEHFGIHTRKSWEECTRGLLVP